MPTGYRKPEVGAGEGKLVRFWIKSSRGTDESETIWVPAKWEDSTIKSELESWCEQFGAWHAGENVVRYGFEVLGEEKR